MSTRDTDSIEIYETWDITIPPIPPRSRLYNLKPIGVGTAYVESLASYIARLASAHCTTPKFLTMYEVLPFQGQAIRAMKHYDQLNSFWSGSSSALNGISPIAQKWVNTLQDLTLRNDLKFLTMLTWKNVIALSQLLRRYKSWCPICYEEWREKGIIYDPLLWAIHGIDICLHHNIPLCTTCLCCAKMQPFLSQTTRIGYCLYCNSWLGKRMGTQETKTISLDNNEWQQWVVLVVGEMVAAAPNLSTPPSQKQFAETISAFVTHYTAGNMSALSRMLQVTVQKLWGYIQRREVPYLNSLLHICFRLKTTPLALLTSNSNPFTAEKTPTLPSLPHKKKGPLKQEEMQSMRQILETIVTEEVEPPPSLTAIAREVGYHSVTLMKYCPDLCQIIMNRTKQQWNNEETLSHIKKVLESASVSTERLPLTTIAQKLGCNAATLRRHFPKLCQIIVKRHQDRFNEDYIQSILISTLEMEQDIPSIDEIARRTNCQRHILRDKFPELCRQIAIKRNLEKQRKHEERISKAYEEIRFAMKELHQHGIFPSCRKVCNHLHKPHIFRMRENYEAWYQILGELGYSTDSVERYD